MTDSEPVSLEFIEDPYLPKLDDITTPSLDVEEDLPTVFECVPSSLCDWSEESDRYLRNLTLDQIFYDIDSDYSNMLDLQTVETEFIAQKLTNQTPSMSIAKRFRLKFLTRRSMREVKVTFIDFSKPYLAKISSSENYKKFLNIGSPNTATTRDKSPNMSEPISPAASVASADIAAEFAALTVEEQEQQRAEWSQELSRVEEEINTLRTVLASKTRHASDLKRKLGITVWKEITDDMNQGLKNVKESSVFQSVEQSVGNISKAVHDAPIFQRTESVLKSTSEKTASVFGSITSGISSKFSQMKNSDSMRSIEEKVGSAYENVKTKVSTSRSGSISSFPDALNEDHSGLNSPTNSAGNEAPSDNMSQSNETTNESNNALEKKPSNTDSVDTCVVCFKNVEIFSIGECDHPVCYECSTRMRVLCTQNECPICRQVLAKVIFTNTKLPYRELETKHRSNYYNKRYKIGFTTMPIQQAFYALLDHPCPKCDAPPYRTFMGLKNHVRKEHDLHYCDLCIEHLKIFTFERRCYTQAELGLHRTKGDADNRSHRGHPLCEYCNKRYLDRDELFRHLRIDHYFCHFCDADGFNEFYKDYDALAQHFRQDHYLCEEGKCATEQFVGAFRTEIDYKAHIAKEHAQLLNKQQAKQTRTLQLEITLGPRGRSGQGESGIAKMRGRGGGDPSYDSHDEPSTSQLSQQAQQHSITIDACNEQDFPSLGGGATGPSVSLIRPPPQSMMNRSGTSGLARTKENFPALGGGGGGAVQRPPGQAISSVVRKAPAVSTGAIARTPSHPHNGNGMVLHVSNRPQSSGNASTKKGMAGDFPALPGGKTKKQNRLEEDMVTGNSLIPMTNVSAKHRTLVDDYVSVANPTNFQKIQMVHKEDVAQKQAAQKKSAPQLTTDEFPSLGKSSGPISMAPLPTSTKTQTSAQWIKALSEKKQRELDNRKSKVAPMPVLPKDTKAVPKKTPQNNGNETERKEPKKPKEKEKKNGSTANENGNGKSKEKNNNNNNKAMNNENKPSSSSSSTNLNGLASTPVKKRQPPPGFLADQSNAPPGFPSSNVNVTVNSVAKSPNNLTFTSSLGESYSILPAHSYENPPEAAVRNQKLVNRFKETLLSPEAFEEFRCISLMFREGTCKPEAYYDHCRSALANKFDDVFPELIALLPDIAKQQALYLVHVQRLPTNKRPNLEVCSTCKQVLLVTDLEAHKKFHNLKQNFPTLSGRGQRND